MEKSKALQDMQRQGLKEDVMKSTLKVLQEQNQHLDQHIRHEMDQPSNMGYLPRKHEDLS